MKRFVAIVEGKGDVKSVPSLIAKAGAAFNVHLVPCEPPILAGGALKLKRPGELERFLQLAATRKDVEEIYVVLDLDDGCAKDFAEDFTRRALLVEPSIKVPIHACFCVREYEALFLSDIDNLRRMLPEYEIVED